MSSYLELEVISSSGSSIQEKVEELYIPAINGEAGILYDHLPYITLLNSGEMRFKTKDSKSHYFFIEEGCLELKENKIILLSNSLESANDMDLKELEEDYSKLKKEISLISKDKAKVGSLGALLTREKNTKCKIDMVKKIK